jgi:TRAP-type mannitol/chloroaromatic compound transport system substrate-binding protein
VEYIGPYDDEKLGLSKVAKNYYTPGWQEGGTVFHVLANTAKWAELPPLYRKAVEVAAQATTTSMLAQYDTKNSEALLRLVSSGVNVSVFSPQIVQTMYGAAQEHYAGLMASNDAFATIYKSQKEFRDRNYLYHQFADFQYDNMMLQLLRKA